MLKIKVLKKKKKGKKSKHKEDDLFKPEELEAYRREHQQQQQQQQHQESDSAPESGEASGGGGNEEWRKFLQLTSGVDDILKKTQGDLDRIKSTSFFQRVPPPSEVKKQEEEKAVVEQAAAQEKAEEDKVLAAVQAAIVNVSESESEEEDEDDIFDTAYVDVLAEADLKLAYIPESPTETLDDDPFDTSYAEKAILGPNAERKGKKLVPLGSAVEILTGRVQAPTCAAIKRPSTRRQVFKEKNLLLDSFDNSTGEQLEQSDDVENVPTSKTLLDDDAPPDLAGEPIDLSKNLAPIPASTPEVDTTKDIIKEFDVIASTPDDEDDEFAQLAAESLSKPAATVITNLPADILPEPVKESWNAFDDVKKSDNEEDDIDPFDTTFAENILPGQAELKIIEQEVLNTDIEFDFNARTETYEKIVKSAVTIQLTNPSGDRESLSSLDKVSENDLDLITPKHRDLLGGSNTDLSQLGDQPLQPHDTPEEENLDYSDPFDTSIVDSAALPRETELKLLERELLSDIKKPGGDLSDDDFDPRAEEAAPPIVAPTNRKVSFELPLGKDLLSADADETKHSKPLTPYYVRENSIPEQVEDIDPFDTSYVAIQPGQTELKLLENELLKCDISHSVSDQDFNPRAEEVRKPIAKVEPIDLLALENTIESKVLTPALENKSFEVDPDLDPFDTSIASNILPGKTELKLLESELITPTPIKRNLTDPEFDPRSVIEEAPSSQPAQDLLAQTEDAPNVKPLTPVSFEVGEPDPTDDPDFDPFDTSIANNLAPGPSELKLLESQLI